MYGLKQMLLQEQKYLEDLIIKAKEGLSIVPEGYLRISKDKSKVRYYHCVNDRYGTYISKGDEQLPKQLAQKPYYMEVAHHLYEVFPHMADYLTGGIFNKK